MINDLLYLAAFRYALGRSSYIVGTICDELIKADLGIETKKTIVREIKEADALENPYGRRFGLGMECDRKEWLKVKEKFVKDLTNTPSKA